MIRKLTKAFLQKVRIVGIAFMLGLANVLKGEQRTIEDTTNKMEHVEETKDDDRNKDVHVL